MEAVIPHIEDPHPETGIVNSKLGTWLFLASEVMLFGALFSTYIILRLGAVEWPRGSTFLNIPLATINTMVLISSSVTIVLSWAALKMHDLAKYRMYMGITILCAFGFLVIKYFEYTAKFEHGLYPSTSTFLAIYFTMTGLHGLHVIGGIVVNGYLWGPGTKLFETHPEQFTNRVEGAGLYWHFVDLVWIFLFPVFYLL
jgi:heme/copper-type cytochrome/quinol oxidase subunit 3